MIIPFTDAITGYGGTVHLNCGSYDSTKNGFCTSQGDWYHNNKSVPVKEKSSTFTIRDADLGNNGIYQCVNNGSNKYTFSVAVYGECISSTVYSVLTWLLSYLMYIGL